MSTSDKPYNLHASVGYQATLSSRVFERRLEENLKAIEITRLQWCILLAIGLEHRETPSEISDFLGINRTATSRALRIMETNRLIARTPATQDRRKTNVSLSSSGMQKLCEAMPIATENTAYFAAKLSKDEAELLQKLLVKLRYGELENLSNF